MAQYKKKDCREFYHYPIGCCDYNISKIFKEDKTFISFRDNIVMARSPKPKGKGAKRGPKAKGKCGKRGYSSTTMSKGDRRAPNHTKQEKYCLGNIAHLLKVTLQQTLFLLQYSN